MHCYQFENYLEWPNNLVAKNHHATLNPDSSCLKNENFANPFNTNNRCTNGFRKQLVEVATKNYNDVNDLKIKLNDLRPLDCSTPLPFQSKSEPYSSLLANKITLPKFATPVIEYNSILEKNIETYSPTHPAFQSKDNGCNKENIFDHTITTPLLSPHSSKESDFSVCSKISRKVYSKNKPTPYTTNFKRDQTISSKHSNPNDSTLIIEKLKNIISTLYSNQTSSNQTPIMSTLYYPIMQTPNYSPQPVVNIFCDYKKNSNLDEQTKKGQNNESLMRNICNQMPYFGATWNRGIEGVNTNNMMTFQQNQPTFPSSFPISSFTPIAKPCSCKSKIVNKRMNNELLLKAMASQLFHFNQHKHRYNPLLQTNKNVRPCMRHKSCRNRFY